MSVNIVNQDGSLTKIAHGFPQSKFDILKSDIANHIETTDMASRDYEAGDVFIMANGHLVRALNDIDEDTTISASDVEDITVTELLEEKADITSLGTAAYKAVGSPNGVAELDANGKIPSSQLPSFVDDVVEAYYKSDEDRFYEEETFETLITPVSGKSWVDIPSNKSYRWTGTVYTRVDEGVQLGETSSTAYRGDRGKAAYDHASDLGKVSQGVSAGLYKISVTSEGHIGSAIAAQASDFNTLSIDAGSVNGISFALEE